MLTVNVNEIGETMNKNKQAETETPCGQDCECHVEPDGFHGKSYKDFLAATEKCQCKEVKTYGMVCVTCGKPYEMKTTFTMNGSAGEWHVRS